MKKTTQRTEPKKVIKSIDELQALVETPVTCTFKLSGHVVQLEVRRVTQDIDERVRILRKKAVPPYIKERNDYDYLNLAYLAARDKNEAMARSLIVYLCCPAVAAKKPGLMKEEDIHAFIKGILTENIVEIIAATASAGEMEVVPLANFISTAASES